MSKMSFRLARCGVGLDAYGFEHESDGDAPALKFGAIAETKLVAGFGEREALAVKIVGDAIREVRQEEADTAAARNFFFDAALFVEFELALFAEVTVADDVDDAGWHVCEVLVEEFDAVALAVDDPEGDEGAGELLERVVEDASVPGNGGVAAGRGVDDDRLEGCGIAVIDELNPAINVVEFEGDAFGLLGIRLAHVGVGEVGFDELDVLVPDQKIVK